MCFLWPGQTEPLFIRFDDYEEVFRSCTPASDGQYKALIYPQTEGTEIVLPRAGRFNVEGNFGYGVLDSVLDSAKLRGLTELTHSQGTNTAWSGRIGKGF